MLNLPYIELGKHVLLYKPSKPLCLFIVPQLIDAQK